MPSPPQPLHLLLIMFAGWVNRHQLDVIEPRAQGAAGRATYSLHDPERRRLARKAHALRRKVLNELEILVTPDTLLRCYRQRVAAKWNYSHRLQR